MDEGRTDGRRIHDSVCVHCSDRTIDALLDRYDAILFDAYGVLVHGSGPLPGAAELLTRLNREDRPYFVVTNDASKLPATAATRYQRFGLPIDASRIITSGMLLKGHFAAAGLAGRRCAVLGPRIRRSSTPSTPTPGSSPLA